MRFNQVFIIVNENIYDIIGKKLNSHLSMEWDSNFLQNALINNQKKSPQKIIV